MKKPIKCADLIFGQKLMLIAPRVVKQNKRVDSSRCRSKFVRYPYVFLDIDSNKINAFARLAVAQSSHANLGCVKSDFFDIFFVDWDAKTKTRNKEGLG